VENLLFTINHHDYQRYFMDTMTIEEFLEHLKQLITSTEFRFERKNVTPETEIQLTRVLDGAKYTPLQAVQLHLNDECSTAENWRLMAEVLGLSEDDAALLEAASMGLSSASYDDEYTMRDTLLAVLKG
jgi:hypothetical protein